MSLYEVLNNYCNRCSGAVSKEDKKKFSYMLRRLFAAQYPIQCEWLNRLDTDALCSSEIIALIASRYNGLPNFLRLKIDQKKKKETIRKDFEDEVIDALKLIKKNFFDNSDKVIVKKIPKKSKKEEKDEELF